MVKTVGPRLRGLTPAARGITQPRAYNLYLPSMPLEGSLPTSGRCLIRLLLHESFHKRLAFVLAVCVRAHRKKVSLNSPQSSEVLRRSPRPRKRERANLLLGWQSREGNASWQTRGLEMPARQREKFPSLQGIGGRRLALHCIAAPLQFKVEPGKKKLERRLRRAVQSLAKTLVLSSENQSHYVLLLTQKMPYGTIFQPAFPETWQVCLYITLYVKGLPLSLFSCMDGICKGL